MSASDGRRDRRSRARNTVVTIFFLVSSLGTGCLGGGGRSISSAFPSGSVRVPSASPEASSWVGAYTSGQRSVAVAGDNVYVAWANLEPPPGQAPEGRWRIYFARSTDGGRSFLPEVRIDDDPGMAKHHPTVAAGPGGRVYVVWQDDRADGATRGSGEDFDVFLAASADGGATFSAPVRVNDNTAGHQTFPSVAVAPASPDTVFVAWEDRRAALVTNDVYFARSADGGRTFGSSIKVNDDDTAFYHYTPVLAAAGSDNVYVVWSAEDAGSAAESHIYFDRSADGGRTFGAERRVDDASPNYCYDPSVALSPAGAIYIAWSDGRRSRFARDIYVASSPDTGASFRPSINVSHEAVEARQEYPTISVSPSGVLWIAYEDYQRDTSGTGNTDMRLSDIYVRSSRDDGATISEPVRINAPAKWGAVAPSIAARPTGNPVLVWSSVTEVFRDLRLSY